MRLPWRGRRILDRTPLVGSRRLASCWARRGWVRRSRMGRVRLRGLRDFRIRSSRPRIDCARVNRICRLVALASVMYRFFVGLTLSFLQSEGAAKGGPPGPDSLESLLSSLGDLGAGEDETELAGFLEQMMGQLISKEVLYEPLKELATSVSLLISVSLRSCSLTPLLPVPTIPQRSPTTSRPCGQKKIRITVGKCEETSGRLRRTIV